MILREAIRTIVFCSIVTSDGVLALTVEPYSTIVVRIDSRVPSVKELVLGC